MNAQIVADEPDPAAPAHARSVDRAGRLGYDEPSRRANHAANEEDQEAMKARIYRPARTAMQSGTAKTERWLLEYEPEARRTREPLMGWTSSSDMRSQIRLWFDTEAEAIAYATKHGIPYAVEQPKVAARRTMAYSDNFRFDRIGTWTH